MKKVLICGSRSIRCLNIGVYVKERDIIVVSGGAPGIDTMALRWADRYGIETEVYRPDYEQYGRAAPLVRDRQMVNLADEVIAFWDGTSKGTAYTIDQATKKDKRVIVHLIQLGEQYG